MTEFFLLRYITSSRRLKVNAGAWRLDEKPIPSLRRLLGSQHIASSYVSEYWEVGNVKGLAFYIKESLRSMRPAKELAMDATYGINSSGMELFGVLGELDGTGVPLAYMFVEKPRSADPTKRANPYEIARLLVLFLGGLKGFGFNPMFFGCDKDLSELLAIPEVWPGVKIQECYWHAQRALQTKLKASKATDQLGGYHPEECCDIIENFEICWGPLAERRPMDHRNHPSTMFFQKP